MKNKISCLFLVLALASVSPAISAKSSVESKFWSKAVVSEKYLKSSNETEVILNKKPTKLAIRFYIFKKGGAFKTLSHKTISKKSIIRVVGRYEKAPSKQVRYAFKYPSKK